MSLIKRVSVLAALAYCSSECLQDRFGLCPGEAGIGDGNTMAQRHTGLQILPAFFQMAFDHHADNAPVPATQLPRDVLSSIQFTQMPLPRIAMGPIHHHLFAKSAFLD